MRLVTSERDEGMKEGGAGLEGEGAGRKMRRRRGGR